MYGVSLPGRGGQHGEPVADLGGRRAHRVAVLRAKYVDFDPSGSAQSRLRCGCLLHGKGARGAASETGTNCSRPCRAICRPPPRLVSARKAARSEAGSRSIQVPSWTPLVQISRWQVSTQNSQPREHPFRLRLYSPGFRTLTGFGNFGVPSHRTQPTLVHTLSRSAAFRPGFRMDRDSSVSQ